jgi:exopolyphosphatase / guanosine-5'-triphosphate,3'-diphosphate pyrophosphatase
MTAAKLMALDVGTHTILAAVGCAVEGRLEVLDNRQWFARLGEGVRSSRRLRPEAIARAVTALREARTLAEHHGAEIAAVATRACRDAENAGDFLRPAAETLGVPVEIVSGEREAQLTFRGAASDLGLAGPALWVDVGGGSTELIAGDGGALLDAVSTPLGAVALTEAHLAGDPYRPAELEDARRAIRSTLEGTTIRAVPVVVGIGGTATSFVALERGLARYDGTQVHAFRLSAAHLREWVERLAAMPLATRRTLPGLAPERAPVVVAGGLVLDAVLRRAGAETLIVSDRGVRHGVLLDRLGLRG